ncbi:MAG: NCS2 family permease [Ignavibacteriae bacterium]|nr:NCS2 family permease [Ignavibacteriota bacterium]
MKRYFNFDLHQTSYRQELLAGATTFVTMAYIIIVNPAILAAAGIPREATVTATILAAAFGTLMMGVYAKRPFAVAPLMGENAFIAFTVVTVLGYSWQSALAAVFISGVLFIVLTLVRLRTYLAQAIPMSLKHSFAVGIGLFLAFIGLNETGIVTLGVAGAPVRMGDIRSASVLLAVLAFLLTTWFIIKRVRAAIILGILIVTALSFALDITPLPETLVSMPASLAPIALQLDFNGLLRWGMFPVIFTVFMMVFVDTLATLFGLSSRANLLDANGNLPGIEKPMLTDAAATSVAALLGTTTTGAYIESAAGIEAGGRTGFTSVVVAALFVLALFFGPLLVAIPAHAYAPSLIIVGLLMLEPIKRIPFDDYTELVPAFVTIVLMVFTFNIGIGMTAGFVVYPLLKLLTGRRREVSGGMWILAGLSLLFFVLAPH